MPSGRLILPLSEPTLDAGGLVTPGAILTVYEAGTTTLADLFSDEALATPIENPQTSNMAGRFYDQTTLIWADAAVAYDALLELPDGEQFSYANLFLVGSSSSTAGLAPLNSPAFTGTPTAPTPATNDASGKIATTLYVDQRLANFQTVAAGAIQSFAMAAAPAGWLECNGAAVSRTAYASLFSNIGVAWGAGDGSTTFNLPDLRGMFQRGWDDGRGVDPGRAFASTQVDAFQGHVHGLNSGGAGGGGVIAAQTGASGGTGTNLVAASTRITQSDVPANDGFDGAPRWSSETRPINVAVLVCIKT